MEDECRWSRVTFKCHDAIRRVAAEERQLDLRGKIIMARQPIGSRLCHLLKGTDVGQPPSIPSSFS